jgi:bla regulator protein blaR1
MIVEASFWFHPLVWWIGARLIEERERACDEDVLRSGTKPLDYAEGILNVCKSYVESPLACVSGVTGANLKKRVAHIMDGGAACSLDLARKALLAAAGLAAVACPLVLGILNAPRTFAQTNTSQYTFGLTTVPIVRSKLLR